MGKASRRKERTPDEPGSRCLRCGHRLSVAARKVGVIICATCVEPMRADGADNNQPPALFMRRDGTIRWADPHRAPAVIVPLLELLEAIDNTDQPTTTEEP